jgi:hypothetical protein
MTSRWRPAAFASLLLGGLLLVSCGADPTPGSDLQAWCHYTTTEIWDAVETASQAGPSDAEQWDAVRRLAEDTAQAYESAARVAPREVQDETQLAGRLARASADRMASAGPNSADRAAILRGDWGVSPEELERRDRNAEALNAYMTDHCEQVSGPAVTGSP